MSKNVQILRSLVEQRLIAAAEEIFGLFERTIAEYEEELCRTKEENQRQRQILDTVLLHTPDTHQQSMVKEEVPPEQKEWSPRVDQNQNQADPEVHHIKEEQEELWTHQEADVTTFLVKNEDEEKAQSSHLHQSRTEKNQEETDIEDCEGSDPASSLDPHRHVQSVSDDNSSDSSETEDSDWTETHRAQLGSKRVKTNTFGKTDNLLLAKERPLSCSFCGKGFNHKGSLNIHVRYHTGEKPFTCSVCTKSFHVKDHLNRHMKVHTGEKPFSCNICGKCSAEKGDLTRHMRVHTGEKPYICSVCGKSFTVTGHLKRHMKLHTTD